jgi:hypothetical protein
MVGVSFGRFRPARTVINAVSAKICVMIGLFAVFRSSLAFHNGQSMLRSKWRQSCCKTLTITNKGFRFMQDADGEGECKPGHVSCTVIGHPAQ